MTELVSYQEYKKLYYSDKVSIVELYTPWCSKCKILKSQLKAQLKSQLKDNDVYYLNIDSDEFIDQCEFTSISGVPQVWIISKEKINMICNPTIENILSSI